jgi:hypothetical protein
LPTVVEAWSDDFAELLFVEGRKTAHQSHQTKLQQLCATPVKFPFGEILQHLKLFRTIASINLLTRVPFSSSCFESS